jgi:hypothetical protein
MLIPEVVVLITDLVANPAPNRRAEQKKDLLALVLTSRTMYSVSVGALYRYVSFGNSQAFNRLLINISINPFLAPNIRCLDFSDYIVVPRCFQKFRGDLFADLNSASLSRCLLLTGQLREVLVRQDVDYALDIDVLRILLFRLPHLEAIDFQHCKGITFTKAFGNLARENWPLHINLSRVSLHDCDSLEPSIFESMMPRLHKLTHLDVAGTKITDKALGSIPHTSRLTHLNVSHCSNLSSAAVVWFLLSAQARTCSLVHLDLDRMGHSGLDANDIGLLLANMPRSLRVLKMKGSRMHPSHLPKLRSLAGHLTELALGGGLVSAEMRQIFYQENQVSCHGLQCLDVSDLDINLCFIVPLLSMSPLNEVKLSTWSFDQAFGIWEHLNNLGWTVHVRESQRSIVRLTQSQRKTPGTGWWIYRRDAQTALFVSKIKFPKPVLEAQRW